MENKARSLIAELLDNKESSEPTTYYKILLLGIRDAYEYHRDLLAFNEPVDKSESLSHYYKEALRFWKLHDRERAVYYLGGALYHIQDAWLGISDNPQYESYLEQSAEWKKSLKPLAPGAGKKSAVTDWIKEAEEERKHFDPFIKEALKVEALEQHTSQVSVHLAQKAQEAGAALLLQFFTEALMDASNS